jgi:hypothetical protein
MFYYDLRKIDCECAVKSLKNIRNLKGELGERHFLVNRIGECLLPRMRGVSIHPRLCPACTKDLEREYLTSNTSTKRNADDANIKDQR